METIFGRFFDHPGQLQALLAVSAVWVLLSGLGALIGGRGRITALDGLLGWAVVCAVFTVAGVFTSLPFDKLAVVLGAAGAVGLIAAKRRGEGVLPAGLAHMLVLAAPLLLAASAMAASQWDEFSHWLPSTRFMLETHTFPDAGLRETGASYPAYPYNWVFLPYLAGLVSGGGVAESAGGLFNLLLWFCFGLLALRAARTIAGASSAEAPPGWGLAALAALAVTIFNPTFVQKVVLTSYADTAAAVCLGAGVMLGCQALTAEAQGDGARAMRRMAHAGLMLMILVNLKQASLVLFVIGAGAVSFAGLLDRGVKLPRWTALSAVLVLPGAALYAVWRFHVQTELPGAEFVIPPPDQWLVGQIPQAFISMVGVLAGKGAYFAVMLLALGFGAWGAFRPRTLFDRLALTAGLAFLGYNAFLLFVYITVMGPDGPARVFSMWRYNMHLGGLSVVFLAAGAAVLWRRYGNIIRPPRWWGAVPAALLLILPIALSHKIRFDRYPDVPHFRAVAADAALLLGPEARVFVIDPLGTGESSRITKYEIHRRGVFAGTVEAGQRAGAEDFIRAAFETRAGYVLVHSVNAAVTAVFGSDLQPRRSYLLHAAPGAAPAGWDRVSIWPYPEEKR
ncbi:MAG: hypothetical protein ACYYKD_13100 [Rhodospirillales bacterium]